MWFIGVEIEQETILDPPLHGLDYSEISVLWTYPFKRNLIILFFF